MIKKANCQPMTGHFFLGGEGGGGGEGATAKGEKKECLVQFD